MLDYLPRRVRAEIERLIISRGVKVNKISELRLRASGRSSILISGERIPICSNICSSDIERTVSMMCDGSLYSARDQIKDGYISLPAGVRVGVCGRARYDLGKLVGISDISSLVIRCPSFVDADFTELFKAYKKCERGVLIYSPPGVGKTTALRALVSHMGGPCGEEVVVVDERCEFIERDFSALSVDVLKGYKREAGMEIALRTLSPSVVAVDEIGKLSEAETMLEFLNSGVKLVATAHAESVESLKRRPNVKVFFDNMIFDVLVGISLSSGKRKYIVESV